MADNPARLPHDQAVSSTQEGSAASEKDRAQELTWALLDDMITREEMAALDGLLQTEPAARSEYLRCVQLHADLYSEFATKSSSAVTPPPSKTPVLGLLQSESQSFGLPSTPAEDTNL